MRFRFWNAGAAEGAYHMAIDRVLWRRIENGQSEPMVRVYTWEPHCVTLGYSQDFAREIDAEALAGRGWTWARRPTGGRAVLHTREFTYSILAPIHAAPWCGQRDSSYAAIGSALLVLLRKVGVQAELARGESQVQAHAAAGQFGPSPACFASTSRLEVTWQGRKLVGSAQRRGRNAFLQHGSLPLSEDYLDLADILPLSPEARGAFREDMRRHALGLAEIMSNPLAAGTEPSSSRLSRPGLTQPLGFEDLAREAQNAFSDALHIDCDPAGLTDAEWAEVKHELALERQVAHVE